MWMIKKLAPFSRLMRNKTTTNHNVLARVLPHLATDCCEFWLAHFTVFMCCDRKEKLVYIQSKTARCKIITLSLLPEQVTSINWNDAFFLLHNTKTKKTSTYKRIDFLASSSEGARSTQSYLSWWSECNGDKSLFLDKRNNSVRNTAGISFEYGAM